MHQNFIRAAAAAAVAATFSSAAVAGGFQLTEQSALGLGRAYAGIGVDGTDVSGLYYPKSRRKTPRNPVGSRSFKLKVRETHGLFY